MNLDKIISNHTQKFQKRGNKALIDLEADIEFHDVLLLKPERLNATLIIASALLFTLLFIVGTSDW